MTEQNLFLARKLAHKNDPETSRIAAKSVINNRQIWWDKILLVLSLRENYGEYDGWTSKEVAAELKAGQDWHGAYYQVARRMNELVKMKKVYICCEKRYSLVGGGQMQAYKVK